MLLLIIGAAVLGWRAIGASSGHGGSVRDASEVEGRGDALTGDTLRVGRTTVRLSGIEAPVPGQTCESANAAAWRCDAAARDALARVLRQGSRTLQARQLRTTMAAASAPATQARKTSPPSS